MQQMPVVRKRPRFSARRIDDATTRLAALQSELHLMVAENLRFHPRVVMRFGVGAAAIAFPVGETAIEVRDEDGRRVVVDDPEMASALVRIGGYDIPVGPIGAHGELDREQSESLLERAANHY